MSNNYLKYYNKGDLYYFDIREYYRSIIVVSESCVVEDRMNGLVECIGVLLPKHERITSGKKINHHHTRMNFKLGNCKSNLIGILYGVELDKL